MGSLLENVEDIEIQISTLNIQDTKNKSQKSSEYQINETTSNTDTEDNIGYHVLQFRDELLNTKNINISKWTNAKISLTEELIKRSDKITEVNKYRRYYHRISTDLDDSFSSLSDLSDESENENQFTEDIDEITTRLSYYKIHLKDFLKSVRKQKKKTTEKQTKIQQKKLKKEQKS